MFSSRSIVCFFIKNFIVYFRHFQVIKRKLKVGSGGGSVGRAVASDTIGPRFESSHRQKFIYTLNICLLSTVH